MSKMSGRLLALRGKIIMFSESKGSELADLQEYIDASEDVVLMLIDPCVIEDGVFISSSSVSIYSVVDISSFSSSDLSMHSGQTMHFLGLLFLFDHRKVVATFPLFLSGEEMR